ncbi:MAG TPA: DUF3500 domain-containing protein [Chthonomonadaceae bacterium]|nr:DUF3500 domain-containing protein [Chthonomonadaceae bacterium]
MQQAAAAFLAALEPHQAQKAHQPFNSEERLNWHYVPKERQGLCFKEMRPSQREVAYSLLRVGLSQKGLAKAAAIRQLENVLREIEQGKGPVRDPDLYFVTIFGEPSEKGVWGWRYEGHHISLHWTLLRGKVIASTPQFLGANPAEVRDGPLRGTRVLAAEEDLARALVKSLDAAQRQEAILSDTAPPDIITRAERKVSILEHRGLAYPQMNSEQQGLLLELIHEYVSAQASIMARQRLDRVRRGGLENIKFAWMGGLERGQGHYYRIQGPAFLIEYDCTQNDANHIHTVWRDFNGDFGADLLERHYQSSPHHQRMANKSVK